MVSLVNVAVEFGTQLLYRDVNLVLGSEDRVGLVGPNGSGKSTILKLIAGEVRPCSGRVQIARGLRIGYLPQTGAVVGDRTVLEEAMTAFASQDRVRRQMVECEQKMSKQNLEESQLRVLLDQYAHLQHQYEVAGYDCEARAKKVLTSLGFGQEDFGKRVKTQSGGFQVRLMLARMLLSEPDLLLLDEPTNYLDIRSIEWLEGYLSRYRGALIMVAHDRYLLDSLVKRIWAIEKPKVLVFKGNYSQYLADREQREQRQQEAYEQQQAFIRRTEAFIAKFKGRKDTAPRAMSRQKMLDKLERIEPVRDAKTIRIAFPESEPVYGRAFELRGVAHAFGGHRVFANVNLTVGGGEKVGVFGANGSGKTTLLRILAGRLKPTTGEVWLSRKTRTAYYEQGAEDRLEEDLTVLETVMIAGSGYTENQLKGILGVFLFKGDEILKKVRVLSGGERSRLAIIKVLLTPSNLLILDEPTNHLDIQSRQVLVDAISRYRRTVVFAAHDRYMLDRVADKTVRVEGGEVVLFPGNYAYAAAQVKRGQSVRAGVEIKKQKRESGIRESKNRSPGSGTTLSYAGRVAELERRLAVVREEYYQAREQFDLGRARELALEERSIQEELIRARAVEFEDSGAESEAPDRRG